MKLSIIIPTYNEADHIVATLQRLQACRQAGHQVIVADGGSADMTTTLARPLADQVITAPKGRGQQMNVGAQQSDGEALLFLHADTQLPTNAIELIEEALQQHRWGRFDVRLSGRHPLLRIVECLMNLRSRLTGIATGDQAIFVEKTRFHQLGGYADIPLMEDIELSKRLKRLDRPACLSAKLTTSSRRWEQHGILNTIFLMWRLRLAYWLGAPAEQLAKRYR